MLTPQELADRVEIQNTIAVYSQAVDSHDWDLLDQIFLPDADIDYRESVPYRGDLAYTKQWLSGMTRAGTYYHLLGLPWIEVRGDTARSRTPCINPMPMRGNPDGRRINGQWYVDDWVRKPAGWRVRARLYTNCYQLRIESGASTPVPPGGAPLPAAEVLQIHDLYARYNHALDAGDTAGYLACFSPDGRLVRDGTPMSGDAALAEFVTAVAARQLQHFTANIAIEGRVTGSAAGVAAGRADVLVLRRDGSGPVLVTSGRYEDELRSTSDGWRFTERRYRPAG
jgi:uncharacterized protein (TIGR02246 family)